MKGWLLKRTGHERKNALVSASKWKRRFFVLTVQRSARAALGAVEQFICSTVGC